MSRAGIPEDGITMGDGVGDEVGDKVDNANVEVNSAEVESRWTESGSIPEPLPLPENWISDTPAKCAQERDKDTV